VSITNNELLQKFKIEAKKKSYSCLPLRSIAKFREFESKLKVSVADPDPPVHMSWASRIRIHYSEVWIRIRILLSSCKNCVKKLVFCWHLEGQ
jgi:hypothetical protein